MLKMGIKQDYRDIFKNNYSANKINKNPKSVNEEVKSRIGYVTQVLGGDRRKKELGGYWKWEDRLREAENALAGLKDYDLNERDIKALTDSKNTLKNYFEKSRYHKAKKRKKAVRTALKGVNSYMDNYITAYNLVKDTPKIIETKNRKSKLEKTTEEPAVLHSKGLEGVVNSISNIATAFIVAAAMIGGCVGYYMGSTNAKKECQKMHPKTEIVYNIDHKQNLPKVSLAGASKETLENNLAEVKAESKKTEVVEEKKAEVVQDKEKILGNGNYIKKDGKWTQQKEIPERKRESSFGEQARDIKESTVLLWHEDVRKHPRANDKYNHVKGKHPYYYAQKNFENTISYVFGNGPDIKQNLFGDEQPLVAKNYEVSLKESLITGDKKYERVDGLLSDLTSIGSKHKAKPGQMIKKTGDDAGQILPSAGKTLKNFFTLNWFGKRKINGVREPGAIENFVDTALYTIKTPLDAICVPLQVVPIVDANGIVEDAYHGIRAVRGTVGSAAATVVNTSQGTIDALLVKPTQAVIPPLGNGIDKTNIFLHDTAQFATTGLSQLFEAELIAENIDPKEDIAPWSLEPNRVDGAIYPYRMPSGVRYLYEAGKNIGMGMLINNAVSGKGESSGGEAEVNVPEPGRSGGGPVSAIGNAGRAGGGPVAP